MAEIQTTEKLGHRTHLHSDRVLSSCRARKNSAGVSWYDHFATQLSTLIPQFGLDHQRQQVLAAFEIIFRESLAIPYTHPAPNFSRINFDGLPLQYSLALGAFPTPLQFIGEVGIPGSSNPARLKLSKERISTLIELLGMESSSSALSELLHETVPEADQDLRREPAGALWLSPAFSPGQRPKLTIYFNARWGPDHKRRRRLARFASMLDAEERWEKFQELTHGEMAPLGAAVTVTADSRPSGRIYLSAFGKTVDYYAALARAMTCGSFGHLLWRYARTTLAEDCKYPTQSAVCSVDLNSGEEPDFKFELCGHCAFVSDLDARSACLNWLAIQNVDVTPYHLMLDTLSNNHLSATSALHAYVGIGLKRGQPYSTIYLKPNATQKRDEHRA